MKKIISTLVVAVVACVVVFLVNMVTKPIIDANLAKKASGEYAELMPEGKGFEEVALGSLKDVDANVTKFVKETNGAGYIVYFNATSSYTGGEGTSYVVSISSEGKIINLKNVKYNDSIKIMDQDANFLGSFVGQDGTLAEVTVAAGATYSSNALKKSLAGVFTTLVANDLVKEAVKSDEQILKESLALFDDAFADAAGNNKYSEDGNKFIALNGTAYAEFVKNGDDTVAVIVNNSGVAKAFDKAGVEAALDQAVIDGVKANAQGKLYDSSKYDNVFVKMYEGADVDKVEVTELSSVAAAYKITTAAGNELLGLVAREYGFDGEIMEIYVVLNLEGKIVKTSVKEIVLGELEYYSSNPFKDTESQTNYLNRFNEIGLDNVAEVDNVYLMAGATISSNAFKQGVAACVKTGNAIIGGLN